MSSILNATTTSGLVTSADNSGSLQLQTNNGTTAVTIDTSQNVGIGTTSPAFPLDVSGAIRGNSWIGRANTSVPSADAAIYRPADNTLGFSTANTERMRIDSSGNLLVGTTAQIGSVTGRGVFSSTGNLLALQAGNGTVGAYMTNNSGTGNWQPFSFCNNGSSWSQIGSITCTASATAYNTSSDYRLKENIAPMTGALAKVAQLKPVTYNWKANGSAGQGFIAHELQVVVPDCVTGEKDAVETYTDEEGNEQTRPVYQGVDTSFLVATLTAAIQEQQAQIEELKAEVQALKGVK